MGDEKSEEILKELAPLLTESGLIEASVLLVPPRIPLTCFPSIISGVLSRIMAREWERLNERAQDYLSWISVKAESVDILVPKDIENPTKGFEMLAMDRDGRSFGGVVERCKKLGIPSIMMRFATLVAALTTVKLLQLQTNLSREDMSALMFTQNVDSDYLNYPMALRQMLRLFPGHERILFLEVNERITEDYLTTIRALAEDLNIRLVLDDSNKMDAAVHWKLLDLADWIKLDFQATALLEKRLESGDGEQILFHFQRYASDAGSAVIVLEGLGEHSPLKNFLEERWDHAETALYYQSRERLPVSPWDNYFGLIQDYVENDWGLFFKGLIHEKTG